MENKTFNPQSLELHNVEEVKVAQQVVGLESGAQHFVCLLYTSTFHIHYYVVVF